MVVLEDRLQTQGYFPPRHFPAKRRTPVPTGVNESKINSGRYKPTPGIAHKCLPLVRFGPLLPGEERCD